MIKTRQLTLIGTVLAVSALSLPFIISETSPKPPIPDIPDLELIDKSNKLGCSESAINFLIKNSNLFDKEFDGNFLINFVGLPADLSQEELDKCIQIVSSIRK